MPRRGVTFLFRAHGFNFTLKRRHFVCLGSRVLNFNSGKNVTSSNPSLELLMKNFSHQQIDESFEIFPWHIEPARPMPQVDKEGEREKKERESFLVHPHCKS